MSTRDWIYTAPIFDTEPRPVDQAFQVMTLERERDALEDVCFEQLGQMGRQEQEIIGLKHELAMSRMKVSALLESRLRAAFVGRS